MAKKKEAYLSLSAMLRAREPRLLNAEKAGRMLEAASFEEAAKLLTDCGYPDLSQADAGQIEQTLTQRRVQLLDELQNLCPEGAIVDFFRMKYDTHNAKVLLKAEVMGTDASALYSRAGRIAPEKLREAWQEEKLGELDQRKQFLSGEEYLAERAEILEHCGETRQSIIEQVRDAFGDDYMLTDEQVEYFASDVFQLADWACIATYLAENFDLDDLIEFDHNYNPEGRRLFNDFQYEAVMHDTYPFEYKK